jgi:hypothetical protein
MASEAIVDAVLHWSQTVVDAPHPVFGRLPVCPVARAARRRASLGAVGMPR